MTALQDIKQFVVVEFHEHEPMRVYGVFDTEKEANLFGVNIIGLSADSPWCVHEIRSK